MSREESIILNVDDYGPGRYARSRVLRGAGYVVVEAATGAEALRLVHDRKPHLVVLDVNLPDMSGFDVCRRIKEDPATAHMVVLHLSASSVGVDSRLQGLGSGGDSYLTEPVEPEELVANVGALLRLRTAEHALRRAHGTLATIVQASPLAVIAIDDGDRVQMWNAAAERLFGWAAAEVTGSPCALVPPEQNGNFARQLAHAREGRPFTGFETVGVRRDGSRVEVSVSASPLGDTSQGLLLMVEDIGPRKLAERDAVRLFEEARRANRANDDFLAVLSHELRTPLNAMLGWVRMLQRGEVAGDRLTHALTVIERNALAQVRLIEDILDVSRIVSGKLQIRVDAVDLAQVARVAIEAVQPQADAKHIALTVNILQAPIVIAGDAHRLQQIVQNLMSNAVKFTPDGGRVRLSIEAGDGEARISVEDSGSGIEPAFLPHVFERFRQANTSYTRQHGGLGLGLAIVRHLVDAHGGTVVAHSAGLDQGSTFTITLPLMAANMDGPSGPAFPDGTLEGKRVLVVDDHEDSREMLITLLVTHGAVARGVGSVGAAIALLPAFHADVIIADVGMPGEDGYALLSRVRQSPDAAMARTPVIAVTGYASTEDRAQSAAAGFAGHISKPVDPAALIAGIVGVVR
jgi:PAS domain S-box-containing protein